MRRVAASSGRGEPSMDGQRVRFPVARRIRPLGATVTYAPHRAAPASAVAVYDDTAEAGSLRWKMRVWIAGGILAALALIAFGVWAVVTADRQPVTTARVVPGGTALAGSFQFTVNGVRCGERSIGPDGLEQRAAGHFCLLDVVVKNLGSEPELFDSGSQRVYDANGVAYAAADQAAVFLNDYNPTLLNEIAPGRSVVGVLPFDVPVDAELTEVSVHGAMSTPGVRITLPPGR